jgi:hypothetical protein
MHHGLSVCWKGETPLMFKHHLKTQQIYANCIMPAHNFIRFFKYDFRRIRGRHFPLDGNFMRINSGLLQTDIWEIKRCLKMLHNVIQFLTKKFEQTTAHSINSSCIIHLNLTGLTNELTPWSWVHVWKPPVDQLLKDFQILMEPESLLLCSQKPTTGSVLSQMSAVCTSPSCTPKI